MKREWLVVSFFLFLAFVIFLISKDFILFWDTIQFAGHHPQYFYESNFSSLFLPNEIDSGHIPLFGMYLAAIWKLFGRSLWITHFAMIPFVFLNFLLAYRLGQSWLGESKAALFPVALIFLPQCISQFMLVSPDIIILAFFFGLILSIEKNRTWSIFLYSTGLVSINNRGFIILLAIIFWSIVFDRRDSFTFNKIKPFIPSISLFASFHLAHSMYTGWIGIHSEMPWSQSFETISPDQAIRNLAIYIWRLMDFGFVIIWIGLGFYYLKNRELLKKSGLNLLITLSLTLAFITIPFEGLMQHRYFMPILVLALFAFIRSTLYYIKEAKKRLLILATSSLFLLLGNSIIYPDKVAQGWDSTLAHLPYYLLQKQVSDYLENSGIQKSEVATAFPLRSPQNILNLNEDSSQYLNKESKSEYILYSNVMNDFTDHEVNYLRSQSEVVKVWQKRGVKMILYKN